MRKISSIIAAAGTSIAFVGACLISADHLTNITSTGNTGGGSSCSGPSTARDASIGGSSSGVCGDVGPPCNDGGGVCDDHRECVSCLDGGPTSACDGVICGDASQCRNPHCEDAVCCNEACTGK